MSTRWFYNALLRLYPRDYAASFSKEMVNTFEDACEEHRRQGRAAFLRFAVTELAGLVIGAGTEWMARLTTDRSVRSRVLPDLRKMRPAGVPRELWFGAAGMYLEHGALPMEVAQAQARVTFLVDRIVHAIANHDFEGARSYSYEESREREHLKALRAKYGLDH